MLRATLIPIVGLLIGQAAAHGSVTSYNINGVEYPGYTAYSPSSSPPSIQREWKSYDPIMSVTDAAMRCNGGTKAALNATLKAGDKIIAKYQQWTHSQGPVMVWLYKCAADFASCKGDGKGWFKIDQMGLTKPPMNSNNWGTDVVLRTKNWTTTIPAQIAAGNYLIRHELLALHQANTPQFYPECAQIVITGGGGQLPTDEFMAEIPAYATMKDPGVNVDIYVANANATSYRCPGPDLWVPSATPPAPPVELPPPVPTVAPPVISPPVPIPTVAPPVVSPPVPVPTNPPPVVSPPVPVPTKPPPVVSPPVPVPTRLPPAPPPPPPGFPGFPGGPPPPPGFPGFPGWPPPPPPPPPRH